MQKEGEFSYFGCLYIVLELSSFFVVGRNCFCKNLMEKVVRRMFKIKFISEC